MSKSNIWLMSIGFSWIPYIMDKTAGPCIQIIVASLIYLVLNDIFNEKELDKTTYL